MRVHQEMHPKLKHFITFVEALLGELERNVYDEQSGKVKKVVTAWDSLPEQ